MNERSPKKQKLKNSRHRASLVGNNFLELAENSFAHPAESERFEEQQLPPEEQKKIWIEWKASNLKRFEIPVVDAFLFLLSRALWQHLVFSVNSSFDANLITKTIRLGTC